jgi:hypothetical protein
VVDIVRELVANREKFEDFDNPNYYNIDTFRALDAGQGQPARMVEV